MFILIDYENVGCNGLKGIESVSSKDKIIIFYRENSTMSVSTHKKMENCKAEKEYICVKKGGKNALDFQLVAYLGVLYERNQDMEFAIISNDGGFDSAIEFLQKCKVQRHKNLAECKQNSKSDATKSAEISGGVNSPASEHTDKVDEISDVDAKSDGTSGEVKNLAPEYADKADAIAKVIDSYKTKQAINNNLMKILKSEEVGKLLKKIKPLLAGKK